MKKTVYNIAARFKRPLTVAHLSDIHGEFRREILDAVKAAKPDIIAVTGDLAEGDSSASEESIRFLKFLSDTAPTFYSLGNHEIGLSESARGRISAAGVHLLDDSFEKIGEVTVGGLTSGFFHAGIGNGRKNPRLFSTPPPDTSMLDSFEMEDGFKILLCHHPEYFPEYIKERKIDLVLSGHAHGGQIRLFGRGVLAPGQGLFPCYTSGVHEARLVISRGLANTAKLVPRLFNETELVIIKLGFRSNN